MLASRHAVDAAVVVTDRALMSAADVTDVPSSDDGDERSIPAELTSSMLGSKETSSIDRYEP